MAQLADARNLKFRSERNAGSSPVRGIKEKIMRYLLSMAGVFVIMFFIQVNMNLAVSDIVIQTTWLSSVIFLCSAKIIGAIEGRKS